MLEIKSKKKNYLKYLNPFYVFMIIYTNLINSKLKILRFKIK